MTISLRPILFPGNMRQPCEAEYGIHLYSEGMIAKAHIVVIQSDKRHQPGTSLWNTDSGREIVLNKILSNDLQGIRVEFVRFTSVLDIGGQIHAMEFPILLDYDDYVARGNPHDMQEKPAENLGTLLRKVLGKGEKQICVWSMNVIGGCERFYTDFERREGVNHLELNELLSNVGYRSESMIG